MFMPVSILQVMALPQARFQAKVVPGASRNRVAGRYGDGVKVQVMAPPEKGRRPIGFRVEEVSSRCGLRRPAGTRGVRRQGKR